MQQKRHEAVHATVGGAHRARGVEAQQGGCYGVQVLIAGRRKRWREEVGVQVRRAGYAATTVDSGRDALTILALGLPVDVLVTDADLNGDLCWCRLAEEARSLRPGLRIVAVGHLAATESVPGRPSRASTCEEMVLDRICDALATGTP